VTNILTGKSMQEITARPVTPMSILVQQLEQVQKMIQNENVSDALATSFHKAYTLAAGLDPYIERNSTPESPALTALAEKTAITNWTQLFSEGKTTLPSLEQEMLSGHLEGQTLNMFVHMTGAKRILEIGMFTGYATLAMAEALPDDGTVIACEIDAYVAQFARDCFQQSPHGNKITVKVAPAMETLRQLAEEEAPFDLVFIDADKGGYIDYFQFLFDSSLLAPNGFICVDNTLLQGEPYFAPEERTANGEAIARFNQVVAEDPRCEQILIPLRDGVTIIRRK